MHRATPVACPQSVASSMQACTSDADCVGVALFAATGRCIPFNGQMLCSYDGCLSDDDCGASPAVCLCEGQWSVYSKVSPGNICRSGNCRTDSDCPGGACSPSVGFGATFYGYRGYYCHTPQDQCQCDSDCASPLRRARTTPRSAPGHARRSVPRASEGDGVTGRWGDVAGARSWTEGP